MKEHQERQSTLREEQERKRRAALAAVHKCTHSMVDSLNSGVEKAYENQRKLDREAKALQANSARYVKQTTQWLSLVEGFNKSLKSLGDLEQWAKTIETDHCVWWWTRWTTRTEALARSTRFTTTQTLHLHQNNTSKHSMDILCVCVCQ